MRPRVVVEADTDDDSTCRVLPAVEALAMDALLFQGPDHTLDRGVLLRGVGRIELLPQTVALHYYTRPEEENGHVSF